VSTVSSIPPSEGAETERRLRRCLALMRLAPLDFGLRVQAGELLIALGDAPRGIRVLRSCADYFTLAGFPIRALWALKLLEQYGADVRVVDRGLNLLAEHYARTQHRDWGDPIFEMPLPHRDDVSLDGLPESFADIVTEVDRRATDIIRGVTFPDRLPRFPLLSELARDPFLTVVRSIRLRRYVPGQALVREGEAGEAVYLLIRGRVEVTKRRGDGGAVRLAELSDGDIFGEMALVTASPRVATVTAVEPVDVFELPRTVLERLGADAAELQSALSRQVCERMLSNLMNLSPLFRAVPPDQRGALLTRFQTRMVEEQEVIIHEGELGRGLFIVLDGLVQVTRRRDGRRHDLDWLREGDTFGEISLLRGTPAMATCAASRRTLLMFLPREEFEALLRRHPEVARALGEIGEDRLLDNIYSLA
jgi:cAMP-dependent protein kinase regulator